jgi:hypothetical protein
MKRFYDAKRQADPDYKPSDKVYLSEANLVTHRPMKKLEARCYGPFTVVRKVGAISYELKLPDSWKVHLVFNTVFLRPWVPPVVAHQALREAAHGWKWVITGQDLWNKKRC